MDWILPKVADNRFSGHRVVVWLFALITLASLVRSLIHIFAPDGGAGSIATVPLATYPQGAADSVVFAFSLWGLSQLLMALMGSIVLLRYRSLIPLMLVLTLVEYASRMGLGLFKTLDTAGTAPGGIGNYVMVPVVLVLLCLSRPRSA